MLIRLIHVSALKYPRNIGRKNVANLLTA